MTTTMMADADEITVERGDILDLRNHLDFTRDRLVSMMATLTPHAHALPPTTFERLCEVSEGLNRLGKDIDGLYWLDANAPASAGKSSTDGTAAAPAAPAHAGVSDPPSSVKDQLLLVSELASELVATLEGGGQGLHSARLLHLAIWEMRWELGWGPPLPETAAESTTTAAEGEAAE